MSVEGRTWLDRMSTPHIIILSIVLVFLLGALDYVTGSEISLSIFYLLPVSLVVLRVGLRASCLIAVIGATVWVLADVLTGHAYSRQSILYWNGVVRLGFFLVVAITLHLRRKTETALRQAQASLMNLFEFAPNPMITVDEPGVILQANEQLTQLFGYSRTELIGVSAEKLLAERCRGSGPGEPRSIAHPARRNAWANQELFGIRKDGSEFPLEIVVSPLAVAGHNNAIVVLRDISGRKILEERLRQYEEGRYHTHCDEQILKLKREINAILVDSGRTKRYDI